MALAPSACGFVELDKPVMSECKGDCREGRGLG